MKKRICLSLVILLYMLLLVACAQTDSVESPAWQEQYDLGVRCLTEGNYEEAIIAFTAAIEIDPKLAPAYVGRGDAYIGLDESEKNLSVALADYNLSLELDERYVAAYLGIADIYIRQGDYDKALNILEIGLGKTDGDQAIADKIAEVKEGNISDSAGNIRRHTVYDEDGGLLYWHDFTYDTLSRRESVSSFDKDGLQTGHVDFEYDRNGNRLVDYSYWGPTGTVGKRVCEFDENGNVIEESQYAFGGGEELISYSENEYNDFDKLIQTVYHCKNNGGGWNQLTYIYGYDNRGNRIKYSEYTDTGKLSGYDLSEYDENNNIVKNSYYRGDGTLQFYCTYHYDPQGKFTGWVKYDAAGNITQSSENS